MAKSMKKITPTAFDFAPLLKEFVNAYQAFEIYDAASIRRYGLTVPQAEVIFSLGQSNGMMFKDLGQVTFITKGTLTGVVDRLECKKLVSRQPSPDDRRSVLVVLTDAGLHLFKQIYPKHMEHLQRRFDQLTEKDKKNALRCLRQIKTVFS